MVEITALSEALNPETLVRVLNGYFEAAWRTAAEREIRQDRPAGYAVLITL
jgi:class 3 adenylate cyclase